MPVKRYGLNTIFLVVVISVSLLTIVAVGTIWVYSEYVDFNQTLVRTEEDFIQTKRQMLKREVEKALGYIDFKKARTEERLKNNIRDRTYEAHAIASHIYDKYKDELSLNRIKELVRESLRPIRYNKGRGYYFATRLDGLEELFADRPEMEGMNLLDMRDSNGKFVIKDMIELTRRDGEGFYEYTWSKPGQQGRGFPKIAFLKYFEPFDWFIGTGEYLDDVEKDIQEEVIERIEEIRFGTDGYIFMGTLEGISLAGPAKGRNMLGVTDANGVKIVRELIDAARTGGGFVHYTMPPLEGKKPAPKLSYALSIDDWGWYLGGGVYVGEIESLLEVERKTLSQRIKQALWRAGLALMGISIGIVVLVQLITRRLKNHFDRFLSFFKEASSSYINIDMQAIDITEFADLAESANSMIDSRNLTEQELQESKKWTESIFNSIQSGIMVIDADTRTVVDVNPEALRIFGFDRDNVLGHQCREFVCTGGEADCPILDLGEEVVNEERILMTADGKEIPVIKTVNKVSLQGRKYLIESFIDLTEKKALEEQLRQSEKMQALGTLAGGIAHDFNNLMMGIQGRISMMLQKAKPEDPYHDHLVSITEYIANASNLTAQLLGLARGGKFDVKPTDINALLEKQVKLLGRTRKDIKIKTEYAKEIWAVEADQTQMIQVFWNLFVNASQAMPEGGTVNITTEQHIQDKNDNRFPDAAAGRYMKFSVRDTGIGMNEETQKRAFDPFFTTKEKERGTGLGLASVYGIIKNHNGYIDLESEEGRGTAITVLLPTTDKAPVLDEEDDTSISRGTGTVLLVDDEAMIREVSGEMIRMLGYDILSASSGRQAVELYREHRDQIGMVILDMIMPGMSGAETYRKLREVDSDVVVVLSSGYSLDSDMEQLLNEGCRSFVQKPFTLEVLSREIAAVILDTDSNSSAPG